MGNSKTVSLVGAALLFVGVFLPLVSLPIVGSLNYFMNGRGDGTIVLLLALVAGGLAMTDRVRHVVWPGAAALAVIGFTFVRFQAGIAEMRAKMDAELAGNPFRGIAETAAGSIQMQWGWAVLVLGAGLLVYAGLAARRSGSVGEEE